MTINAVHVDCFPSCRASCCSTRSALRKNKELPKCRLAARHSPNHKRWCFPTDNPSTDLMLIRTRVAGACILSLRLYGGNKRRTKSSCLSSGKGTETHDPLMSPRIKRSILWCSAYAAPPRAPPGGEITNDHMSTSSHVAFLFTFFCRLLLLRWLSGKITCSVLLSMLIMTCTWKRLSPAQPHPCA